MGQTFGNMANIIRLLVNVHLKTEFEKKTFREQDGPETLDSFPGDMNCIDINPGKHGIYNKN